MNICRNRLWGLAARLPRSLDPLSGNSIRINSVVAHKWYSIVSAHNQKSIDLCRWTALPTASINESFVVHMSSLRNVHVHKRDIKYEEKIDEKGTKPQTVVSDERNIDQLVKSASKKTDEKEIAEPTEAPKPNTPSDDLIGSDPDKKLGLFARFKLMSKQYWYVLLPVHVVTSCFWFGGLYYLSTR